MTILTLASTKGGVGKSTLTGHLACEAERQGAGPVAIIDLDPQGSLAEWWNSRAAETPLFARAEVRRLRHDLEALARQGIALVIIDTPPALLDVITAELDPRSAAAEEIAALWQDITAHLRTYAKE